MSTLPSAGPAPLQPGVAARLGRRGRVAWMLLAGLSLLLAGCELAGWPFLRGPLEQQIAHRLGVTTRIDAPFKLHWLYRPGLQAHAVFIGSPPAFGVPHLVQAEQVALRWRWRDLWAHQTGEPWPVTALQAARLDTLLRRRADGSNNWGADADSTPARPATLSLPVRVAVLAVEAGRVSWHDQPLQLSLEGQFSWQQGGAERADRLDARAQGRWRGQPFALQAQVTGLLAQLEAGPTAHPAMPIELQARIGQTEAHFRGVAADLQGAHALSGSLLLRGASLGALGQSLGIPLPATPPYRLAAALHHDAGLWGLVSTEARIGGSRLALDVQFDGRGARPLLTGRIGGPLLRLKDLGPAVGMAAPRDTAALPAVLDSDAASLAEPAAPAATGEPRRPGRVLPDRSFDLPSLQAMDVKLRVAMGSLDLGNDAVIEPLRELRAQLTLQDGVLSLAKLQAQVAGGTVSGLTRLDATDPAQPARWHADLQFGHLRLEQWLPVLKHAAPGARGGEASGTPVPLASGILDGRLDVRGSGRNTAAILASLDGRASARVREGTVSHLIVELAGLDLAQSLGVFFRGDRPLPLSCARMDLQLNHGVATLRQFALDTHDSSLSGDGRIDLRDESIALRLQVHPKDFSPLALRTPIVVSGSLAAPQVGIEGGRLAPRLLAVVALALTAAPVAWLPLLDFGDSGQPPAAGCAR
jgi:AsmA family protein